MKYEYQVLLFMDRTKHMNVMHLDELNKAADEGWRVAAKIDDETLLLEREKPEEYGELPIVYNITESIILSADDYDGCPKCGSPLWKSDVAAHFKGCPLGSTGDS